MSGQAGTGKSFLVDAIVKSTKRRGRKIAVVCSSGISCSVFGDSIKSRTVHSQYALETANMPSEMVISRAKSMWHCMREVKNADTIIWDEAGMSSKRIFELVNAIHQAAEVNDNRRKPFGGKQLIVVGEFLQLRPVPNSFDDGEFMFRSALFHIAIPHRLELTLPMRQACANSSFITALQELRLGRCSEESVSFLNTFSRPIEGDPVHIYFKKLSVQLHNLEVLFRMPGELFSFDSKDEGNVSGISCPAEVRLLLKPQAKVMITWNISDTLKNGTSATFLGVKDGLLEVEVPEQGIIILKQETWLKRNRSGEVVGSRTQFPVVLFYASTCHRAQGLTLPCIVVHCTKEFVSGLIYVAVSRVRSEENLQLCGFDPRQLLKPSQEALKVCERSKPEYADLSCCSNQKLQENFFTVNDIGEEFVDGDADAPEALAMDAYPDGLASSFFKKEEDVIVVDLEVIFLLLDDKESEFGRLPESFDFATFLRNLMIPYAKSEFAMANNTSLNDLLHRMEDVRRFLTIQWLRIYELFGDHLVNNPSEMYFSRKDLSKATHNLYIRVIGSADLRKESRALFQVQELSEAQLSIASTVCLNLFEMFVHAVADTIVREYHGGVVDLNVSEMSTEGLAKLRHVAGWAFRKELEKSRRYLRTNMFSLCSDTRQRVNAAHANCQLMEDHIIVQYSWLQENTAFPGTLEVTEDRQYRERGLIHITDAAFRFTIRMETMRVALLNTNRIKQCGSNGFVDNAIVADDELVSLWADIFMGVAKKVSKSNY